MLQYFWVLVEGSEGSDLNHTDLWWLSTFVVDVQRVRVIAGNDKNNRRGVEGHPFLWPVVTALWHHSGVYWLAGEGQVVVLNAALLVGQAVIMTLWHHDGAYWLVAASQGVVLNAALQVGQVGAQQLQHAIPKLSKNTHMQRDRDVTHENCSVYLIDSWHTNVDTIYTIWILCIIVYSHIMISYSKISNIGVKCRVYFLHLPAHEAIYNWVVSCAWLGEKWGDDGNCGWDGILLAKSCQHGYHSIGCPAQKITETH